MTIKTVEELIEQLRKFAADAPVRVSAWRYDNRCSYETRSFPIDQVLAERQQGQDKQAIRLDVTDEDTTM